MDGIDMPVSIGSTSEGQEYPELGASNRVSAAIKAARVGIIK